MDSRHGLGTSESIAPVSTKKRPSQVLSGAAGFRITAVTCVTPISSSKYSSSFQEYTHLLQHFADYPARSAAGEAGADDAPDPAAAGAFRTGEVVARIWIAPFVDAEGVYREGSWVRAVIAPAEWRLP